MQTVIDLLPYVLGGYEVISRAIPTKKDHTLVGNIFKWLSLISNFLNNTKK